MRVSRLIRTRFAEISLPRHLKRGRWEELDPQVVSALMAQLQMNEDGTSTRQPISHENAMPPGFEPAPVVSYGANGRAQTNNGRNGGRASSDNRRTSSDGRRNAAGRKNNNQSKPAARGRSPSKKRDSRGSNSASMHESHLGMVVGRSR